jgi:CHAT domain-containing protein
MQGSYRISSQRLSENSASLILLRAIFSILLIGISFTANAEQAPTTSHTSASLKDITTSERDRVCSLGDYQKCKTLSLKLIEEACGGVSLKTVLNRQQGCDVPYGPPHDLTNLLNTYAISSYQLGQKQDAMLALLYSRKQLNLRAREEFSLEKEDSFIHYNARRMEQHYNRWGEKYAIGLLSQLLVMEGYSARALDIVEQVRPPWAYLRERSVLSEAEAGIYQLTTTQQQAQSSLRSGYATNALSAIAKKRNMSVLVLYMNRPIDAFDIGGGQRIYIAPVVYAWLVKPTGRVFFRMLPLPKEFEKEGQISRMIGFHQPLFGSVPPPQEETLKRLYSLLIDPISSLLADGEPGKYLTIIPYGQLNQIPFAALADSSGQPLIDRYALSYAESVSSLLEPRPSQKVPNPGSLINHVIGNPKLVQLYRTRSYHSVTYTLSPLPFKRTGDAEMVVLLPDLPNAEAELRNVAAILDGQVQQGEEATVETVIPLLEKSDVVHFATHSLPDSDLDIGSPNIPSGALMLTPSKTQPNGLLSSDEIYRHVATNARLINLSACSTGIGSRFGSEGIMLGLGHAFLVAGAQSVLYSLWDVPDAATNILMSSFYKFWYQEGLSRPVALQQAMLQVRKHKEFSNPYFWGGFVLSGYPIDDHTSSKSK